MDLEAVELLHVRLPLVRAFSSNRDTTAVKDALVVRIVDRDGAEGWGECAAQPAPTYAGDFLDGAWLALRDHLVPRLGDSRGLDAIRGNHMAKAALEMAQLDLVGRREGRSLAELLGGHPGRRVPVGVVVEMDDDDEVVAMRVTEHIDAGYRRVKIKIGPQTDPAMLERLREVTGTTVALWADANGALSPADGDWVAALPLDLIEQPLAAGDLVEHAAWHRTHRWLHISLDESITSIHDARAALALDAASSLVIKAGRVGGLRAAAIIHDHCVAAGVAVWCGGMLETGIGRAANLALASLDGFTLPGDISATDRYFARDLTERFVLAKDGTIGVPEGPGLGVEIDREFLDACVLRRETVRVS